MFGRIASQLMAFAAIVGVFVEIPIVSNYAFWFMFGAYLTWMASTTFSKKRFKPWLMVEIVLILVAIVGVFVEIPIVSNYALWVMAAAYLIVVSVTG